MKNGTIIGFRILVDTEGLLVTEHIELPDEDIPKVFKEKENQLLVRIAKKSFKEITEDGKGGLMFEQKNPVKLADNIKKLLEGRKLYTKKTKECGKLAEKYDWDTLVKKLESTYKKSF